MTRWISRPLTLLKRGLTSLFVCVVVALPVISLVHWAYESIKPADATSRPAVHASTAPKHANVITVDY